MQVSENIGSEAGLISSSVIFKALMDERFCLSTFSLFERDNTKREEIKEN